MGYLNSQYYEFIVYNALGENHRLCVSLNHPTMTSLYVIQMRVNGLVCSQQIQGTHQNLILDIKLEL